MGAAPHLAPRVRRQRRRAGRAPHRLLLEAHLQIHGRQIEERRQVQPGRGRRGRCGLRFEQSSGLDDGRHGFASQGLDRAHACGRSRWGRGRTDGRGRTRARPAPPARLPPPAPRGSTGVGYPQVRQRGADQVRPDTRGPRGWPRCSARSHSRLTTRGTPPDASNTRSSASPVKCSRSADAPATCSRWPT